MKPRQLYRDRTDPHMIVRIESVIHEPWQTYVEYHCISWVPNDLATANRVRGCGSATVFNQIFRKHVTEGADEEIDSERS